MVSTTAIPKTAMLALRHGEMTAPDFLAFHERRFSELEPHLRAFVPETNRFERLRRAGESLTSKWPQPSKRPPLFGLLVGVKDIFHVDGFTTRAGSRLPASALAGSQARAVTRLTEAGALILGKTVTTEFAYFTPGLTRNPHNHSHTPGGSSSGSAAAVAAGLCDLALGTQTIGSIVRPAAFCGVIGLKPTHQRVSGAGVIPLSPTLDHVGFLAADLSTAQLAAEILYDAWKPATGTSRQPVLGVPEGPYLQAASQSGLEHFRSTCRLLAEAGYEIKHLPLFPDFLEVQARHDLILSAEAAAGHAEWFAQFSQLYSPKTVDLIRRGQRVAQSQLQAALEARDTFRLEIERAMVENGVDLWITPSACGPAPEGLDSTGNPIMNLPWTQAGLPAIGLPAGYHANGMPLGLQLIGRWAADEALLSWAGSIGAVVSAE